MTNCKKNILLIEDDASIRTTLQGILEDEGFKVFLASNGEEGLHLLKQVSRPCIILLDLFMPVMSGMEFLKALNEEDASAVMTLPIVVVSAAPSDTEAVQEVKPFLKGFIKKPLDLNCLLDTVDRFCNP